MFNFIYRHVWIGFFLTLVLCVVALFAFSHLRYERASTGEFLSSAPKTLLRYERLAGVFSFSPNSPKVSMDTISSALHQKIIPQILSIDGVDTVQLYGNLDTTYAQINGRKSISLSVFATPDANLESVSESLGMTLYLCQGRFTGMMIDFSYLACYAVLYTAQNILILLGASLAMGLLSVYLFSGYRPLALARMCTLLSTQASLFLWMALLDIPLSPSALFAFVLVNALSLWTGHRAIDSFYSLMHAHIRPAILTVCLCFWVMILPVFDSVFSTLLILGIVMQLLLSMLIFPSFLGMRTDQKLDAAQSSSPLCPLNRWSIGVVLLLFSLAFGGAMFPHKFEVPPQGNLVLCDLTFNHTSDSDQHCFLQCVDSALYDQPGLLTLLSRFGTTSLDTPSAHAAHMLWVFEPSVTSDSLQHCIAHVQRLLDADTSVSAIFGFPDNLSMFTSSTYWMPSASGALYGMAQFLLVLFCVLVCYVVKARFFSCRSGIFMYPMLALSVPILLSFVCALPMTGMAVFSGAFIALYYALRRLLESTVSLKNYMIALLLMLSPFFCLTFASLPEIAMWRLAFASAVLGVWILDFLGTRQFFAPKI